MRMNNIILPELGEGIEKAVVALWYVRPGDLVKKDDDVVELVTDKASFNIPAAGDGRIKEIHFHEGQEVKVGSTLATMEPSLV